MKQVQPLGYPNGATICGIKGCIEQGLVYLCGAEANAYLQVKESSTRDRPSYQEVLLPLGLRFVYVSGESLCGDSERLCLLQ